MFDNEVWREDGSPHPCPIGGAAKWIYCNEVARYIGFHTHFLTFIPKSLLEPFKKFLDDYTTLAKARGLGQGQTKRIMVRSDKREWKNQLRANASRRAAQRHDKSQGDISVAKDPIDRSGEDTIEEGNSQKTDNHKQRQISFTIPKFQSFRDAKVTRLADVIDEQKIKKKGRPIFLQWREPSHLRQWEFFYYLCKGYSPTDTFNYKETRQRGRLSVPVHLPELIKRRLGPGCG
jgi:hypothetical protein